MDSIPKTNSRSLVTQSRAPGRVVKSRSRRNLNCSTWMWIDREVERRKTEKRKSNVYIDGQLLEEAKLRKELSRNVTLSSKCITPVIPMPCPEGIEIRTPKAVTSLPSPPFELLPWHAYHAATTAKVSAFHDMIVTDQAQSLIQSSVGDTSLLRQCLLPVGTTTSTADIVRQYLKSRILEIDGDSLTDNLDIMLQADYRSSFLQMLQYATCLWSNNLLNAEQENQLLAWLSARESTDLVALITSVPSLTNDIIVERLLLYAVEKSKLELLDNLLQLDLNATIEQQVWNTVLQSQDLRSLKLFVSRRVGFRTNLVDLFSTFEEGCSLEVLDFLLANGTVSQDFLTVFLSRVLVNELERRFTDSATIERLAVLGLDVNALVYPARAAEYLQPLSSDGGLILVSPLQLAVFTRANVEVLTILIAFGAHVEGIDNDDHKSVRQGLSRQSGGGLQWSALTLAAAIGNLTAMRHLKSLGADVNAGYTDCVASYVDDFLEKCSKHDRFLKTGRQVATPLEVAYAHRKLDCFRQLLEWRVQIGSQHLSHIFEFAYAANGWSFVAELEHYMSYISESLQADFHKLKSYVYTLLVRSRTIQIQNLDKMDRVHLHHENPFCPADFCCQVAILAMYRKSCQTSQQLFYPQMPTKKQAAQIIRLLNSNMTGQLIQVQEAVWMDIRFALLSGSFWEVPPLLHIKYLPSTEADIWEVPISMANLKQIDDWSLNGMNPFEKYHVDEYTFTPMSIVLKLNDVDLFTALLTTAMSRNSPSLQRNVSDLFDEAHRLWRPQIIAVIVQQGFTFPTPDLEVFFTRDLLVEVDDLQKLSDLIINNTKASTDVNMQLCITMFPKALTKKGLSFPPNHLLQIVSASGDIATAKFLIDHGADVNADPFRVKGRTALQVASMTGNLPLLELYIQQGADVNAEAACESGRTALQCAVEEGHYEVVLRLLEAGANVNQAPAPLRGVTALQAAAIRGFLPIAQLLIDGGAIVTAAAASSYGRTALQGAAKHGRADMLQLLLNHYDSDSWREDCIDAAGFAENRNHFTIAKWLREYAQR